MFALACFIGIYSYGIFALGIFGIITKANIVAFTLSWSIIVILFIILNFRNYLELRISNLEFKSIVLVTFLIAQLLVNLVGALGPELGFDALWYHLTQPKIWLQEGIIRYIPGNIFRYSVTPQLTETLYAAALSLGNELWAKLIHYVFGFLSLVITYKLSRKFLTVNYSLLSCALFSGNLVFSWLQTTAYIDLSRTFFESLALLLFLEQKYTKSAITLGLAICSKLISFASLPIFMILMFINRLSIKSCLLFTVYCLLICTPWLLFAYFQTGNPFYPIGSLDLSMPLSWNPLDIWHLFTRAADPVNPVYIITAPLIIFINWKKQSRGVLSITAYVLLALLLWFMFPHTGGSRYFLPYLPAMSVLTIVIFTNLKDKLVQKFLVILTLTLTLTTIIYRFIANYRYLSVLSGRQTKRDFLIKNLNFSFGDYIDVENTLDKNARVYPLGINNLFYINSHLILPPKKPDQADYLLIRHTDINYVPDQNWKLIKKDLLTKTSIYSKI